MCRSQWPDLELRRGRKPALSSLRLPPTPPTDVVFVVAFDAAAASPPPPSSSSSSSLPSPPRRRRRRRRRALGVAGVAEIRVSSFEAKVHVDVDVGVSSSFRGSVEPRGSKFEASGLRRPSLSPRLDGEIIQIKCS
eukprot:4884657-Pyramimonas_sp.AAC.1